MARKRKSKVKAKRRCSVCRSAKHDKRKCRSKKSKRHKTRKRRKTRHKRKNPGLVDSVAEMGLSYDYGKRNPCKKCGCTCKDVAAGAARYLRKMRRNPGWSFREGRVSPHEQQFSEMHQRRRKPMRRWNPYKRNSCGSDHKKPNPWLEESSIHEPLNKRIRRLCRSDLSPYEISNYMNVPTSWVTDVCQTERRYDKNPSTSCQNCGTGNREGRDICWKCGFDLAATPVARMAATRKRAWSGSPLADIY